jgi:hypothetical protein
MKATLVSILMALFCLSSASFGFVAKPSVVSTAASTTSLNVFGNKKSKAQKAVSKEEPKYWQGEWVCKDCGYIYNRVSLVCDVFSLGLSVT